MRDSRILCQISFSTPELGKILQKYISQARNKNIAVTFSERYISRVAVQKIFQSIRYINSRINFYFKKIKDIKR